MTEPSEPTPGVAIKLSPNQSGVQRTPGRFRSFFSSQSTALFLVLVALTVFFSVLRPDAFLRIANVMNMATNASILLVLAVGSTFIIRLAASRRRSGLNRCCLFRPIAQGIQEPLAVSQPFIDEVIHLILEEIYLC
jgi:hypothetical protein